MSYNVARSVAVIVGLAPIGMAGRAVACSDVPCTPESCAVLGANGKLGAHAMALGPTSGSLGSSANHAPVSDLTRSYNLQLMSHLSLAQIGGGAGSSLYGWVDPQTGHEYAIMGRSTGTAFVDITNPAQPLYVANLPRVSGSTATSWREPKVYQNTVYVGVDGTSVGMQVMDLTKLRTYTGTTLTLAADKVYTNVTKVHTLAINPASGYLYADGTRSESTGLGGLHVIDVRNPANPTFVTEYNGDNYTHESQVVTYHGPDTAYQGRELAFNSNGKSGSNGDTFSIVDVTNKSAITRVASKTYPNAAFIHQGWLTEDQRYFFQNDELDEENGLTGGHTRTHLWDVSDLDNPVYKGYYDHAGTSIDHNLYVKNGFLFETNYTSGLHMLKIGNLASSNPSDWLKEVAAYDTYTANDAATFNGAWNNYPFFPSGNIAISDINGGLFVVRPTVSGWAAASPIGPATLNAFVGPTVPEPAAAAALMLAIAGIGTSLRRRPRAGV